MEQFTNSQLAHFAEAAVAQGHSALVFDYWCELGEMIAGFAIQTEGWHFQIPADKTYAWLMGVPDPSASRALCEVCDLARPGRARRSPPATENTTRARLAALSKCGPEEDPVYGAARLLAAAAVTLADRPLASAGQQTAALLEVVQSVALKFEESWSAAQAEEAFERDHPFGRSVRRAAFLYVRGRAYDLWSARASVGLLGDPAPPSAGEVERALASCSFLAQGRLVAGPRTAATHPRYEPGSLQLFQAPPTHERNLHRLFTFLRASCSDGWWIGWSEYVELNFAIAFDAGIAAWRKERFPSDPGMEINPPPMDSTPARARPDWVCDAVTPETSAEELHSKGVLYAMAEIPWYWLVDMRERKVQVWRLVNEEYQLECTASRSQRLALPPFESVELDAEPLFQDL